MSGKPYRTCRSLDGTDAAYIAGLIDGEGTVTLTRKHKKDYRQLALSISSNERVLLEYVLKRTGVGFITNKRKSAKHHAPSYNWAAYNRQALAVLKQVLPHLRSYKRKRTNMILKTYLEVTPRNGKYTKELLDEKRDFEARVLAIKPTATK